MTQVVEQPQLTMARARFDAELVVRVVVALVLIAAAVLKALAPDTGAASRIVLPALEIAVAAWLVSGRNGVLSWLTVLVLFGAFAVASFSRALRGDISCGCFGTAEINPWWSLTIDLVVIAGLLHWHPLSISTETIARMGAWTSRVAKAVAVLALVVSGFALSQTTRPANVARAADVAPRNPRDWVGLEFPFLRDLKIDTPIDRGLWTVVLVSQDCGACRREAPMYDRLAEQLFQAGDKAKVALIAFGSTTPRNPEPLLPPTTRCHLGVTSVPRGGVYDIVLPTAFVVQDGIVQYVSTEP